MTDGKTNSLWAGARRKILLGLFTLIPIWLTLLLISVILNVINDLAAPAINWLTSGVHPTDTFYQVVKSSLFQTVLSLAFMLGLLYASGWLASRWLGQQLLVMLDNAITRIPVANSIYKAIKRLADALQVNKEDFERVVLIEFPSPEMKTIGLVTKTFEDSVTGRKLAAVYVPTTPNPTSGYLEIVPVERLVPTNWKFDEAMSFIISGGADVPSSIHFDRKPAPKDPSQQAQEAQDASATKAANAAEPQEQTGEKPREK
jgi:uncharacterized membrane protein